MNDMSNPWNSPMGMNMNMNLGNNPMNMRFTPPAPKYEVIRVNGESGARNFRMAPNSSMLLLDETQPIVWYAQTDGGGFLTVTPFDVTPHQQTPPIDINNLAERISKLEEYYVQQSNSGATKQSKKQRQPVAQLAAEPMELGTN